MLCYMYHCEFGNKNYSHCQCHDDKRITIDIEELKNLEQIEFTKNM